MTSYEQLRQQVWAMRFVLTLDRAHTQGHGVDSQALARAALEANEVGRQFDELAASGLVPIKA